MNNENEKKFALPRRRGKVTRYYVDNELVEHASALGLRPADIAVYNVLARHANSRDQSCFPSFPTIMKMSGIKNRTTLSERLQTLERLNLIAIKHSLGFYPNVYILLDPVCWGAYGTKNATDMNNKKEPYQNDQSNSISTSANSPNTETLSHINKSDKLNHKNWPLMKKQLTDTFSKDRKINISKGQ